MRHTSVMNEVQQIHLAAELISLGARLQLLEQETTLSRERLVKLYKEIRGESPPKGMLPFSADWFLTWSPNIHSSIFLNIYRFLGENSRSTGVRRLISAYKLYQEHIHVHDQEEVLSITRAWMMLKFFEGKMLHTVKCKRCTGHFVAHADDLHHDFVCGVCQPPSRAGKKKRVAGQVDAIADKTIDA